MYKLLADAPDTSNVPLISVFPSKSTVNTLNLLVLETPAPIVNALFPLLNTEGLFATL